MAWRKARSADRVLRGSVLALISTMVILGGCGGVTTMQKVGAGSSPPAAPATPVELTVPVVAPPAPAVAAPVAAVSPRVTQPLPPAPPETAGRLPATVPAPAAPDACAVALAYLAAHSAPGFAHYCRPGSLQTALGPSTAYTCRPGIGFSCPDGVAEIIIAKPTCPASYENEASNSFWDFSQAGVVRPGTVQNGRTWDPFGACP